MIIIIRTIGIKSLIPRYTYFLPNFLLCAIPIEAIMRNTRLMAIKSEKGTVNEPIGIEPVKPGCFLNNLTGNTIITSRLFSRGITFYDCLSNNVTLNKITTFNNLGNGIYLDNSSTNFIILSLLPYLLTSGAIKV